MITQSEIDELCRVWRTIPKGSFVVQKRKIKGKSYTIDPSGEIHRYDKSRGKAVFCFNAKIRPAIKE